MGKFIDLTGQRFERWVVLERRGSKNGATMWLCRCDCGAERIVVGKGLRAGRTKSCGCYEMDSLITRNTKHNLSKHPLYNIRACIVSRCTNADNRQYCNYGGRGITVCDDWLDKENGVKNFIEWAENNGYKEGLDIDREDNDGKYEPSNCRWVGRRANLLNRRNYKTNKSGYVGVSINSSGKWASNLGVNGRSIYLGCHNTDKQALEARNNYIKENNLEHEYKVQKYIKENK